MKPYDEREAVKSLVADLVIECLWDSRAVEAHGETNEHDIKAWRDNGIVRAEVRHK